MVECFRSQAAKALQWVLRLWRCQLCPPVIYGGLYFSAEWRCLWPSPTALSPSTLWAAPPLPHHPRCPRPPSPPSVVSLMSWNKETTERGSPSALPLWPECRMYVTQGFWRPGNLQQRSFLFLMAAKIPSPKEGHQNDECLSSETPLVAGTNGVMEERWNLESYQNMTDGIKPSVYTEIYVITSYSMIIWTNQECFSVLPYLLLGLKWFFNKGESKEDMSEYLPTGWKTIDERSL